MKAVTLEEIQGWYDRPLFELVREAHAVLGRHFTPGDIQTSKLLSIKTGACTEDCAYCSQSARYSTGVEVERLLSLEVVVAKAKEAKAEGATRFCMGAAWREVRDNAHFDRVLEMARAVKALGLEVCCTLGMITLAQAKKLKAAGVYAYNHNLDSSERFYKKIIQTRKYEDRLRTIQHVREAGMTVCTGGILGMGETHQDRIDLIGTLANLTPQPESVTVNALIPIPGTPLAEQTPVPALDMVRFIATARICLPRSIVRLSAGRLSLSHAEQFLCFYAGANSLFLGEKLLTSPNPDQAQDQALFDELHLSPKAVRPMDTQQVS